MQGEMSKNRTIIKARSHIMYTVKVQSIAPVHFRIVRCHQLKKRHHLWLLLLKVFHRLAESSFPEVEMPTMGSLTVHCEAESYCVCVCACSDVSGSLLPHGARQAPLPMEFSRQECWSGLPFPTPGDLQIQGLSQCFLQIPCIAGGFFTVLPLGHTFKTPYFELIWIYRGVAEITMINSHIPSTQLSLMSASYRIIAQWTKLSN